MEWPPKWQRAVFLILSFSKIDLNLINVFYITLLNVLGLNL